MWCVRVCVCVCVCARARVRECVCSLHACILYMVVPEDHLCLNNYCSLDLSNGPLQNQLMLLLEFVSFRSLARVTIII